MTMSESVGFEAFDLPLEGLFRQKGEVVLLLTCQS